MDIMDVWFDSGSSHRGVLENRPELSFPIYILKVVTNIVVGLTLQLQLVATRGQAPYKFLLSHGFVMDGEGKKMSKSLGNVIVPDQVVKQKVRHCTFMGKQY